MQNTKKKNHRILLALLIMILSCFFVGVIGWFLYTKDARAIHAIVYEDCRDANPREEKIIVSHELLRDMSVIPKAIELLYSYSEQVEERVQGNDAEICHILNSAEKDWVSLSWYAAMEDCNYLAYPRETDYAKITACGYERIGSTVNYDVYRHSGKKYNTSWLISQHGNGNNDQLMFYTLQNRDGDLIVVDGGWSHDATYVRDVIAKLGNHITAWLITHPHPDHVGAFCEIYQSPGDITIDRVYAVNMAPPALCLENASWDDMTAYEQWLTLEIPQLNYVSAGDVFEISDLKFQILSAYGDYVDEISNDLLNDGSMVFKITAEKESMLFCADAGINMSDYLLREYGDILKSDYLQMGHHGNGGLSDYFYTIVNPKVALFDAPDWLMEDANNQYTTPEHKQLMLDMGAEVYSFTTAPNRFILE